jgi:DNA-directed RNA polymerase specialized sigma24 family protein
MTAGRSAAVSFRPRSETLKRAANSGSLSPQGFDRLLAVLDGDREQAGLKYEALRRKLLRFFDWRDCRPAEELADETLDRVARKLAEGVEIRLTDPGPYVYAVARNVAREVQSREARQPSPGPLTPSTEQVADPDGAEDQKVVHALDCLERCLEGLPPETRRMLLLYHADDRRGRLRQRLVEGLRLAPGTLWVRMHRLRKRLERCVDECLQAHGQAPAKGSGLLRHSSKREEGGQ